jgi:acyl carrier protein
MDAYAMRGYEEPDGEVETVLAEIWAELLKVERVGRHDNFFELGGHSMLAVQLISRIRQVFAVEITLRDLFVTHVISSLGVKIIDAQLAQFDSEDLSRLNLLLPDPL